VLRRDAHGGGELRAGPREAHRGSGATVHSGVTLVERKLEGLGTRPAGTERRLQIGYERADFIAADM
jgi:hypothetical protein